MRSLLAVVLIVGLTQPGTGLAQEPGTPPSSLAPADLPLPSGAFQFGLANLSGPWPDRFLLFGGLWSADAAVALHGVPSFWGEVPGPDPQRLVGLRTLGLGVRFGGEVGPDGRRRLALAPLYRDWDDLTGWEKFGLTLQYAGVAAAIGHFVGKLAH